MLRKDLNGEVSLEIVRLLNRMIKERTYRVNARVLDLLLHLRLRDELGNTRADTQRASRGDALHKSKVGKDKAKPKDVRAGKGQHLSKKQVKEMRERAEIDEEMKEANAEVDLEERERNVSLETARGSAYWCLTTPFSRFVQQTETLKLLFVLYFSILKAPSVPGPLLASSLEGLSRFAHRVNVDFFRDLLAVLRAHTIDARQHAELDRKPRHLSEADDATDEEGQTLRTPDTATATQENTQEAWGAGAVKSRSARRDAYREALHCLVTAYELLSGQGEALNIELSDMASHLYALITPLALSSTIEEPPTLLSSSTSSEALLAGGGSGSKQNGAHVNSHLLRTDADLLIRALEMALLRPRVATFSSEVNAAFVKRMLSCALHLPPATACRLLGVAKNCVARDEKLEALLDTNDRARNGKFDPETDNLDAARPLAAGEVAWELHLLIQSSNADVAAEARQLANWQR